MFTESGIVLPVLVSFAIDKTRKTYRSSKIISPVPLSPPGSLLLSSNSKVLLRVGLVKPAPL